MSASTQSAHVERFNLTLRHEWLNMNMYGRVTQAKELPTHRLWIYNNERPYKAFGVIPPANALKAA